MCCTTIRLVEEMRTNYKEIIAQTGDEELELDLDKLDKNQFESLDSFVNGL